MKGRMITTALVGITLSACAGQQQMAESARGETELREEIEALKLAIDASYDRERAISERLRTAAEANSELRRELNAQQAHLRTIDSQIDTLRRLPGSTAINPPSFESRQFDAPGKYRAAREQYNNRQYERALGLFAELIRKAPRSNLADNGQYWMGECYYGLGKFRQALTEFTKVFAYPKTEKDDDAQLKIARCYLVLGEQESALIAFQKLLDEYADSEYVDVARKEMTYLEPR